MNDLSCLNILLGVSAGIAAYKSAELTRRLRDAGADVRVVMTPATREFITPLTFQALSGNPVRTDLFNPTEESAFGHIDLARWADRIVIAPATADILARLACGMANDLLSTLCLASSAPLMLVPAMNRTMWEAEATQANCRQLRKRGVEILEPAGGMQACGEIGAGRMPEAAQIVDALSAWRISPVLQGKHILISAGPTREFIDPVRFISNRSSGKMGYALALAAKQAGARVILVSGPVHLPVPAGVECEFVQTAAEMHNAILRRAAVADIFIAAAAVADYRPVQTATRKIKKKNAVLQLELEPCADILAETANLKDAPFCCGFAAETDNLAAHAQDKLKRKKLDIIAANRVDCEDSGFDSDNNALCVYWQDGGVILEKQPKLILARKLIQIIAERYAQKNL